MKHYQRSMCVSPGKLHITPKNQSKINCQNIPLRTEFNHANMVIKTDMGFEAENAAATNPEVMNKCTVQSMLGKDI